MFTPDLPGSVHPSKNPARFYPGGCDPALKLFAYPVRDRNSSDMAALSDQINDCPAPLALFQIAQFQRDSFVPAKAASQEKSEECSVSFALHGNGIRSLPERPAFFG